jgi:hypothetical protein
MEITRLRPMQQALQVDLPGRGCQQIHPSNNIRHALVRIIYHYGQLISKWTIRAAQHKITNRRSEPLLAVSLHTVGERDTFIAYTDTPCPRFDSGR